jgi:type IV pilus assembly protein PilC
MPTFRYKARDKSGIALTGTVEAAAPSSVTDSLKGLGYQIIYVEEHRGWPLLLERLTRFWRRFRPQEIVFFTRQLAMMVKAGLPLTDAIQGMSEQPFSPGVRRSLVLLVEALRGGKSFSEALELHPRLFSQFYLNMVRSGEAAGSLAEVLERLAAIGQEELELRGRISSALAYPCLLVLLSIGIVTFLLVAILPKFVGIFEESGVALPLPTVILLGVSQALSRYWVVMPVSVAAAAWAFGRYSRTPHGRYRLHQWVLKLPVLGAFIHKTLLSRFCRVMATLLKSGIPAVPALAIANSLVRNEVLAQAIAHVREAVIGGASLSEPIRVSRAFPPTVVQMVSVGERTGSLDQMFRHLGEYYDQEVEQGLRTVTSLLEPMLLLVMGLLVGFIALSVLLPIFQLIRVFKQ